MPSTVPYTQLSSAAASGSDFWACTDSCTLTPHITNATLGVTDFLFADTLTITGKVQATQFAGKQVSVILMFDTCSPPTGWATILVSQLNTAETHEVTDLTPNCPAKNNVLHGGTMMIGSDGIITISLSPKREDGNVRDSAYYGNFVLQLTGNTTASASSASSGASASASAPASTSSSISRSGSTISITSGTGSLSGSTTLTGSQLSEIPSLALSWTSAQTAAVPGSSPGVGGGSSESPSSNKGAIIGGAIAGVLIAIVGLVVIWRYLRRRRASWGEKIPDERQIVPLSHDGSGDPGTGKWIELQPSRYDALRVAEKDPNLLVAANAEPGEPLPISSETIQHTNAEPPRRPPSVMFSATGLPTYESHENANQNPFFLTEVGDQRGPYTLDDTFRVHDLLGEWAEEHRDAVPHHLERRLRIGGYVPGTDPNEIAQELWLSRFDVTRFELAGLVELFERTNGMPTRRITPSTGSIADH